MNEQAIAAAILTHALHADFKTFSQSERLKAIEKLLIDYHEIRAALSQIPELPSALASLEEKTQQLRR